MIISVLQNVYFNMDKHISRSDGVKSNCGVLKNIDGSEGLRL